MKASPSVKWENSIRIISDLWMYQFDQFYMQTNEGSQNSCSLVPINLKQFNSFSQSNNNIPFKGLTAANYYNREQEIL